MSILRPVAMSVAIVVVSASCLVVRAQPAPTSAPPSVESFETVNRQFQKARDEQLAEIQAAVAEARKNGTLNQFKFAKEPVEWRYSRRFLAIAERNPEGPEAIFADIVPVGQRIGIRKETK